MDEAALSPSPQQCHVYSVPASALPSPPPFAPPVSMADGDCYAGGSVLVCRYEGVGCQWRMACGVGDRQARGRSRSCRGSSSWTNTAVHICYLLGNESSEATDQAFTASAGSLPCPSSHLWLTIHREHRLW